MKRLFCTSVVAALLIAGSVTGARAAGGVAIIDLDKCATTMGWLEDMQKRLQSADTELKAQLNTLLQNSLKTIEDAKKEVAKEAKLTDAQAKLLDTVKDARELEGLPLSKDQREKLVETVNKANAAFQQAVNNYQQLMQNQRAQLIMGYRDKIRPSARRVAAAKGLNVVLTSSDNVLYFDPQSADITDAVIDDLQKTYPKTATTTTPTPAK